MVHVSLFLIGHFRLFWFFFFAAFSGYGTLVRCIADKDFSPFLQVLFLFSAQNSLVSCNSICQFAFFPELLKFFSERP